jgi:ribosomal protein L5
MTLSQKNFQKGSIITRCFFYKNVHEIPLTIEKITLFYTLKKDISLKSLVKASTLLQLISAQRAFFLRSQKPSIFLKIRKGAPVGVKVTLRNKALFSFLLQLIWEIFPNVKNFRSKLKLNKAPTFNALTFNISDPFLFNILKDYYFIFKSLSQLRILCSLNSSCTKKENFFNARFLQLPF